jgi:hypothetical protein
MPGISPGAHPAGMEMETIRFARGWLPDALKIPRNYAIWFPAPGRCGGDRLPEGEIAVFDY